MKNSIYIIISVALAILVLSPANYAQRPARGGEEEVLMLEEIRIEVTPELPTVVVTIPRQKPDIKSVTLEKNVETLLTAGAAKVKPRLTDMTVSKVEDLQKILAKERSR
ncbi:MAG: hypothetical protein FJY65_02730 [Calditrichaeota bacterium]|nr:hypothetical protein [Calditrichota bacterium]